jgi:biopolymer transport protein ExbB/TolQ
MQKAKEKVKLVSYTVLKKEVDTLHTIDTTAKDLVLKLLREVNKRDSIIAIDSMQVQALIKISNIQAEQLQKATEINETLTTEINKPKKALKYSLIANFVLLLGLLIK